MFRTSRAIWPSLWTWRGFLRLHGPLRYSVFLAIVLTGQSPASFAGELGGIERVGDDTAHLIASTMDVQSLTANFEILLASSAALSAPLDDARLRKEFARRYWARWQESMPTPRLQTLLWLAECNKQWLFEDKALRARNLSIILAQVQEGLKIASPEEAKAWLSVGMSSVFYGLAGTNGPWIVPQEGGDEIFELLKLFMGDTDKALHSFARDQLRYLAACLPARREDIKLYLSHHAPEIRSQVLADPTPGVNADPVSGVANGLAITEERWLAVDTADVGTLAELVKPEFRTLRGNKGYPSGKALARLVRLATMESDSSACEALEGIVPIAYDPANLLAHIINFMIWFSAEESTGAACMQVLLDACLEARAEQDRKGEGPIVEDLQQIHTWLQERQTHKTDGDIDPGEAKSILWIERYLSRAIDRMKGMN